MSFWGARLSSQAPGLSEDNLGDKLADIGDNSALQDSGAPALSEDNLGDKLADKLRPGGRIGDNSALQDFGAPGLSEDNLGDKLADKLGDNLGPEARIGDNSASQDCGAPGLSEAGLETILRYRILGPGIVRGQSGRQTGGQTGRQSRPGGPDWRQFCVTGFRGPRIVRGQSGRQIGGQTEARRPGLETILRYRIPGPREDNLGDKLADKLRPAGLDWRQFCVTGFRVC